MKSWFTTSRITGLFYLGLAVSGVLGYLMVGSKMYVPGDAAATVANLAGNESLARFGLVAELGIVAFQVLAALWFFKLFRKVNSFAAISLAVFGILGAVAVMVGLMFSAQALHVALAAASAPAGDQAASSLLLWELHESAWTVGNLFFGLWLIPMGYLALAAKMPRALGWIIVVGGIGYVLSGVLLLTAAPAVLAEVFAYIATIGELWIIGYLLRGRFRSKEIAR